MCYTQCIMTRINLLEKKPPLLLDYCHFLSAGFENFTQTYFAGHTEQIQNPAISINIV